MIWKNWDEEKPDIGKKIIIACSDGCSTSSALMADDGPLDGEDAWKLGRDFLSGSIWCYLPDNYHLAFMEKDYGY